MEISRYFIKKLTKAEANTSDNNVHEIYIRLTNDFNYEEFFQTSGSLSAQGTRQIDFKATDITFSNQKVVYDLKFVYYENSNREKRIPSMSQVFTNRGIKAGDIVCLESRTTNGHTSFYITFCKANSFPLSGDSMYYCVTRSEYCQIDLYKALSLEKREDVFTYFIESIDRKVGKDQVKKYSHTYIPHIDKYVKQIPGYNTLYEVDSLDIYKKVATIASKDMNPDPNYAGAYQSSYNKYGNLLEELLSSQCRIDLTKFDAIHPESADSETSTYDDHVLLNSQEYSYIAAIKTKPFLILGGFSGTGKSQKVLELAFATCPCDGKLNVSKTSPGNYLLVSVKPNWHDATDITGFRSSVNRNYYVTDFMRFLVKAKQYPKVPFFVCLDEMNLAPVEEYFADFLSVIESRKKKADGTIVTEALVPASVFTANDYADDFNIFMNLGLKTVSPNMKPEDYSALSDDDKNSAFESQYIVEELKHDGLTIPQNVVIIGTVNMDDTTNSFSRKVIDRAMTFETVVNEFDDSYFKSDVSLNYIQNNLPGNLFISDEVRATQMLENGDADFTLSDDDKQKILNFINDINRDLEGSPFKVSYRILNETILYYRAKKKIEEIMNARGGFEAGVIFNTDLDTIFDDVLMQKVLPRIEGDYEKCHKCLSALGERANIQNWNKSKEKIEFMINRFGSDNSGFTNFWN